MTSKPLLFEDQSVDMAFTTCLLGVSDKWIYRPIKNGIFPKPIELGQSSRRLQSEVEAWLQMRVDELRSQTPLPTYHFLGGQTLYPPIAEVCDCLSFNIQG